MRHMARLTSVAAAVILLLSGTAGMANAGADRPFKGRVDGLVSFSMVGSDVCPALGLQTESNATGTMRHMGATSMYAEHCTPTGAAISDGDMTLTAANGDKVYLAYDGIQLDLPDFMGGTLAVGELIPIEGDFEVVGGTGRFDGATGGGTWVANVVYEGLADPAWAGTWSYAGTINY